MSEKRTQNINDVFFEGHYKEVWRKMIPAGLTEAETDFIEEITGIKQGDLILDLMCGYGRHSIELAKRGYQLTSVDNQPDYIEEIKEKAQKDNLLIEAIQQNVTQANFTSQYDAAICMGNSFAFFDYENALQLLLNLAATLKKGGKFIINTWMIGEIAIRHFQEKIWHYVDEYKYLLDNKYLLKPTRIESDHIIITPNGKIEVLKGVDYIFTLSELEALLNKAGFEMKDVYYTPRKRKFTLGDNKAYIVAEKM